MNNEESKCECCGCKYLIELDKESERHEKIWEGFCKPCTKPFIQLDGMSEEEIKKWHNEHTVKVELLGNPKNHVTKYIRNSYKEMKYWCDLSKENYKSSNKRSEFINKTIFGTLNSF